MSELSELLDLLNGLKPEEYDAYKRDALSSTKQYSFVPNPGPQTMAYNSLADVVLYAGGAGSGKSNLSLGLATQEHTRSIIFRREASQTDGLIADAKIMLGETATFNGQDLEFKWGKGKSLKLAGMKEVEDWRKHAGRERDLIVFDECAEFLQTQVQSAFGWLRGPPGQRCRILLPSNPPRSSDGYWVMEFFAPWFDDAFPNPAECGELRWAVMSNDKTVWVDGPAPVEINGEQLLPHSRTFIRAMLKDNPYRDTPEYRAKLMMTPEPLRSQLLYGDFKVGRSDRAYQVIPTAWIRAAQERWRSTPPPGVPMTAIGVDVSGGGTDSNILSIRHDGWFDKLIEITADKTPLGTDIAGVIVANRRDNAMIIIDCGGGYGGVAYTTLKDNGADVYPYKGSEGSTRVTKDGLLKFVNRRTEAHWMFREALDPSQPGGSTIMLPDDPKMVADLTAADYKMQSGKLKITTKEELVKQLGRSPDRGDAVVMAWFKGAKGITSLAQWDQRVDSASMKRRPQVILGHARNKSMYSNRRH